MTVNFGIIAKTFVSWAYAAGENRDSDKKVICCNCSPLGIADYLDMVTSTPIHGVGWIVTRLPLFRAMTLST